MKNKKKTVQKFPWEAHYPHGLTADFAAVEKPVHHIFEASAEQYPTRYCLDFLGKKYTYAEVAHWVNSVAAGLQNLGVKKGDKIGLCLPNSPYFVFAYYAALKVGATVVNFNPLYTTSELLYQAQDAQIKLMFCIDVTNIAQKVETLVDEVKSLEKVVLCPLSDILPQPQKTLYQLFKRKDIFHPPQSASNSSRSAFVPFSFLLTHGDKVWPVDINPTQDVALVQYTGGTTGKPKGALLTHCNISSNAEQIKQWLGPTDPDGERFMAVIPFFHVFANSAILNLGIATSSEIILLPRFDLKQCLQTINRTKVTIFPAVPTLFGAMCRYEKIDKYDLSSIRYCISGGAALPADIREQFEALTGCVLVEGYGLTESSPVAACNPPQENRAGSIGLPLPGTQIEIRNLENKKKAVKMGERGELFIKGPQVMLGYHQNAEATKETLLDGWLATGDVGYIDEDGFVHITDRLKEIIISNGYNIYPRIIEEAIYLHPDVDEVIVIGVADKHKGEVPKAFVKLKSGASINASDMLKFCREKLNPLERPKHVEFRDELPKTLIGKLSKKELIQEEKNKESAHE